jgi:hypothetical protein
MELLSAHQLPRSSLGNVGGSSQEVRYIAKLLSDPETWVTKRT